MNLLNREEISLEKTYKTSKTIFIISPFVMLLYLYLVKFKSNIAMEQTIEQYPEVAIVFLSHMMNPVIAYLLTNIEKRHKDGDIEYTILNLTILTIGQIMIGNIVMAGLLIIIIVKTLKISEIKSKEGIKIKWKKISGGSIIMLIFASICMFSSIKIKM